jgi:hypothetical protein
MKASVQAAVNTPVEDLERNILSSVERVPIYDGRKMAWGGTAAICGSGPSLPSMLGPVGWCDKNPKIAVFAIKGAHDFLIENEIIPDVMVMMDAKPDQVRYVKNPNPDVEYWIATQCDPSVFTALEGQNVIGWHGAGVTAPVSGRYVGGGRSTGVRSIGLAASLGFTILHFFGCDCSFLDGNAYSTNEGDKKIKKICDVEVNGQTFVSTMDMVGQAFDFMEALCHPLCPRVIIYGDGLLPTIAGLDPGDHAVRVRLHDPEEKLIYGDDKISWKELNTMAGEDGWIEMPLSLRGAIEAESTTATI